MKKGVIITLVLAVIAAPLAMLVFALSSIMMLSSASQAQAAGCISPVGYTPVAGAAVRLPVTGSFSATSEYGMRHNPGNINHGEYRLHAGIDLASASREIVAATDGVVSAIPTTAGGGISVTIDHGNGLVTRYLHLASRSVAVGDQVWGGRVIGVEGETGNVSGVHLHFEVEVAGIVVDPRTWMAQHGLLLPAKGGTGTAPPAVLLGPADDPFGQTTRPALVASTTSLGTAAPLVSLLPTNVGAWQGEQVTNAAQVIKAGQDRGLDVKTITIAVMTAMAESSLTNLPHGDAVRGDTIGVFQEGPERGPYDQRMNPYSAAGIFYDYLLKVPDYLTLEPTLAAHEAQSNADPYHYESRWADAVVMVSTLTADPTLLANLPAGGPVTGCADGGPAPFAGTGDGTGQAIVDAANHYLGTPYSWGGGDTTGPTLGIYSSGSLDGTSTVGFDCSGLVIYAVNSATGVALPHSAELQGKDARGTVVARDFTQMLPGDVVAFSEDGSGANGSFGHVGIYIGDGKMIHAPRPGKTVEIVQLQGSSYYEPMAWNIRRYAAV